MKCGSRKQVLRLHALCWVDLPGDTQARGGGEEGKSGFFLLRAARMERGDAGEVRGRGAKKAVTGRGSELWRRKGKHRQNS